MADPKKGTGKKPKGSGRRLYTDENPRDTVRIKFATPSDARATVAKVKRVNKPFARKIQILTVMEQRAKVMGKSKVASIVVFSFFNGLSSLLRPLGFWRQALPGGVSFCNFLFPYRAVFPAGACWFLVSSSLSWGFIL